MENEELVSVISNAMASAISEALTPLQSQLDALKAEPKNDVVPGWAKALTEKFTAFEGQKTTDARLQMLEGKFANVPDSYKSQRLADAKLFINTLDDNGFNEYLTKTESDIAAFNQELADKGLSGQGKPMFGQKDNNGISSGVASFIQGQTSDLGGKDLHGKTPFNPNPQKQDQGPTTLNGVLTGKTI